MREARQTQRNLESKTSSAFRFASTSASRRASSALRFASASSAFRLASACRGETINPHTHKKHELKPRPLCVSLRVRLLCVWLQPDNVHVSLNDHKTKVQAEPRRPCVSLRYRLISLLRRPFASLQLHPLCVSLQPKQEATSHVNVFASLQSNRHTSSALRFASASSAFLFASASSALRFASACEHETSHQSLARTDKHTSSAFRFASASSCLRFASASSALRLASACFRDGRATTQPNHSKQNFHFDVRTSSAFRFASASSAFLLASACKAVSINVKIVSSIDSAGAAN